MNYRIEYTKKGIPGYLYKYAKSTRELLVVLTDLNTEWIDFETIKISLPPADQDNMRKSKKKKYTQLNLDFTIRPEDLDDRPQHIIDEETIDLVRELRKEQAQMEMFDDPVMNWSGLR